MFDSQYSFSLFSREVINRNRYAFSPRSREFLAQFARQLKSKELLIDKSASFFRTQKGADFYPENYEIDTLYVPGPLKAERMKPIPSVVHSGRINPKGIAYLYLSEEKETSVNETRPWIGESVTVAEFVTNKKLKVVKIQSSVDTNMYINKVLPKELIDEYNWAEIYNAFSIPVSDSNEALHYIPTQILAETIKNKRYDGIVFKSSVGRGSNLCLFYLDNADVVRRELFEVISFETKIKYFDNPYFINST